MSAPLSAELRNKYGVSATGGRRAGSTLPAPRMTAAGAVERAAVGHVVHARLLKGCQLGALSAAAASRPGHHRLSLFASLPAIQRRKLPEL